MVPRRAGQGPGNHRSADAFPIDMRATIQRARSAVSPSNEAIVTQPENPSPKPEVVRPQTPPESPPTESPVGIPAPEPEIRPSPGSNETPPPAPPEIPASPPTGG